MKKLWLVLFGGLLVLGLAACNIQESDASTETYVLMEINPSIEFILDEEDIVISYSALNDDAELLLEDSEVEFGGLSIDEAIDTWLDLAIDAGFLDATREDNVVYLTVVNDDPVVEEEKRERMKERAEGYMVGRSIGGVVEDNGFTQEEFLAEAAELGVSPGFLRIAYAASADDEELTLEDALELSIPELMGIIHSAHGMPNHRQHREERMPDHAGRGRRPADNNDEENDEDTDNDDLDDDTDNNDTDDTQDNDTDNNDTQDDDTNNA